MHDDEDDDHRSTDAHAFFSLLPSAQPPPPPRLIVHNQALLNVAQISSARVLDYVQQWYERHSMPSLSLLVNRDLLKIYQAKSIRMSIGTVS